MSTKLRSRKSVRAVLTRFALLCCMVLIALPLTAKQERLQQPDWLSEQCVERHLSADGKHGGTDYGAAFNAAIQTQPLREPSVLRICKPGNHPVYEAIRVDRPLILVGTGATLVPMPSLSATPVRLPKVTLKAGQTSFAVPSGVSLAAGQAVGGWGVEPGTTITSVVAGTAQLSKPPRLIFHGIAQAGSAVITAVDHLRGLAVGQTCSGCGSGTVVAIDFGARRIRMSEPIKQSLPVGIHPDVVVTTHTIHGSWQTDLVAVRAWPVIRFEWNEAALHNTEHQMIGAGIRDITIADQGSDGNGRSLKGVQGVQVNGYDRFSVYSLTVDNLAGSGLILGGSNIDIDGQGSVRESNFYDVQLRDCGDAETGQPSLAILSPAGALDQINQVHFSGGSLAFNHGVGALIGNAGAPRFPADGPRLLFFGGNWQAEGGDHTGDGASLNTPAPEDQIHIQNAGDVYFDGTELAAPGFGFSVVRIDSADLVSITNSRLFSQGKGTTYHAAFVQHSDQVTYLDGGRGTFEAVGKWDDAAFRVLDEESCRGACRVSTATSGAVTHDGKTLVLATPFEGASGVEAIDTVGGGYMFTVNDYLGHRLTALGNLYNDSAEQARVLGLENRAQAFLTGAEAPYFCTITDYDGFGPGITVTGNRDQPCRISDHGSTSVQVSKP